MSPDLQVWIAVSVIVVVSGGLGIAGWTKVQERKEQARMDSQRKRSIASRTAPTNEPIRPYFMEP